MDKINIQTIEENFGLSGSTDLVVIDDIQSVYGRVPNELMVEGFIFCIVLQGNATICMDNDQLTLSRGDIFGCDPRHILQRTTLSIDLQVLGFFATPEFTKKLLSQMTLDWSFLMIAKTHEVLHADDDLMDRLVSYIQLIRKKLDAPQSEYSRRSVELLIQSMGLEIFDMRQIQQKLQAPTFSQGENIARRFLFMLAETRQQGRPYLNVKGYADLLSITPKHFSAVCRQVMGKSASEIIKEEILRSAEVLLADSSLSIKEVASRLGFANQSHFGTFIRRHCNGRSPHDLRGKKN